MKDTSAWGLDCRNELGADVIRAVARLRPLGYLRHILSARGVEHSLNTDIVIDGPFLSRKLKVPTAPGSASNPPLPTNPSECAAHRTWARRQCRRLTYSYVRLFSSYSFFVSQCFPDSLVMSRCQYRLSMCVPLTWSPKISASRLRAAKSRKPQRRMFKIS